MIKIKVVCFLKLEKLEKQKYPQNFDFLPTGGLEEEGVPKTTKGKFYLDPHCQGNIENWPNPEEELEKWYFDYFGQTPRKTLFQKCSYA